MTPRTGLRFPSRPVVQAACASGLLWLAGCGHAPSDLASLGDADASEPSVRARGSRGVSLPPFETAFAGGSATIEESLARLDALELIEVGGLYETRTEHSWIPYGGFWSASETEMSEQEVAARLDELATVAEEAVAAAETQAQLDDVNSLCWGAGDSFCLSHEHHNADLEALDALEIVHVEGMVRDNVEVTGACYSSWDTVTAADCERAYRLHAVVEATRDFDNRNPPAGDEQP